MAIDVENCKFAFKCTKKWEELAKTEQPKVRFCDTCSENVYLCESLQELDAAVKAGHCVAFDSIKAGMYLGTLEDFTFARPIK